MEQLKLNSIKEPDWIKQLYPDNWKYYFNKPDLGKEAI